MPPFPFWGWSFGGMERVLAKIFRPSKSAMQSGRAASNEWLLEWEADIGAPQDALMGWTGSADTRAQIRLSFASREEAVAYARARAIPHQVIEPQEKSMVSRAYSDNFAFARREPWSH